MLMWLKRSKDEPNKAKPLKMTDVAFVGEQDGDVERSLKSRLTEHFKSNLHIRAAYLVQVRYGNSPELKVALCLDTRGEVEKELVQAAASEFAGMFGPHESLDIMFLSPKQRQEISVVAKPFYCPSLYRA